MWSYMGSYIKCSSKMQLRWKIFFQAIRETEICFPDRLACFRLNLIFFFKLLTEALLDPETNQLVLINAALVLVWMLVTLGHHWLDRTTALTPLEDLRAGMWVWSLRMGQHGKQQISCLWMYLGYRKLMLGLHWPGQGLDLLVSFPAVPISHHSSITLDSGSLPSKG